MKTLRPGPKSVKNVFGFLDESGHLKTPMERVFALGIIKLHHPTELHRKIINLKNKYKVNSEFKSTNVADKTLGLYKKLIDIYFNTNFTYFSVMIFDKNTIDLKKYYKDNQYNAYNSFTAKLISDSLDTSEYIAVIADDVTTPKDDNFEKSTKIKIKKKLRRNALFGIIRAESHAFTILQMVDVLVGLTAYAFKIKYKQIKPDNKNPKLRALKYLQSKLNEPILCKDIIRKMKFDRVFKITEVNFNSKKIDSALGEIGIKSAPTLSV